jgi:hypothetical protein
MNILIYYENLNSILKKKIYNNRNIILLDKNKDYFYLYFSIQLNLYNKFNLKKNIYNNINQFLELSKILNLDSTKNYDVLNKTKYYIIKIPNDLKNIYINKMLLNNYSVFIYNKKKNIKSYLPELFFKKKFNIFDKGSKIKKLIL